VLFSDISKAKKLIPLSLKGLLSPYSDAQSTLTLPKMEAKFCSTRIKQTHEKNWNHSYLE